MATRPSGRRLDQRPAALAIAARPDGSAPPPARRRSGTGAAPGPPAPAAAPADRCGPASSACSRRTSVVARPSAPSGRSSRWRNSAVPRWGSADRSGSCATRSTRASAVGGGERRPGAGRQGEGIGSGGHAGRQRASQRLGAQVAQAAALVVGLIAGVDQRDFQLVAVRLQHHQQAHEDALAEQLRAHPQHDLAARGDRRQRPSCARRRASRRRRRARRCRRPGNRRAPGTTRHRPPAAWARSRPDRTIPGAARRSPAAAR